MCLPRPPQLRTRTFVSLLGARRLVPAIDMLNHAEEPNAEVTGDAALGAVLLRAIRPIALGEEVLNHYSSGVLHRDDAALYMYGFLPQASPHRQPRRLQPRMKPPHAIRRACGRHRVACLLPPILPAPHLQEHAPPRLCALDLPTYTAANPWRPTDATDDRYGEIRQPGAGAGARGSPGLLSRHGE